MIRFVLTLLFTLSLCLLAHVRTDGFTLTLIQGALLEGASPSPSSEVLEILQQKFHYLAKGRQSFVFESEDGRYVLKFFNQKYFKYPWYWFLFKEHERWKRGVRRRFYETSYLIAYEKLGEEILYVHLASSPRLPPLHLVDRASNEYAIEGTLIPFVLQRKGTPLNVAFEEMWRQEGDWGLCKAIDSFLDAISLRISKQIADADHNVLDNWGYIDGHIFHLDPGRLYIEEMTEPLRVKEEWDRATHHLYEWLKTEYPAGASYLKMRLEKIKDQIDGRPS